MKQKLILSLLVVALITGVGLFPSTAHAIGGFGGQIVVITPCLYPFGGFHIELGPPSFGSYLYQAGVSRSFLFGPPAHPGQWLLGLSSGGISCATSLGSHGWEDWLAGGLILFHGSSL